MSWNSYDISNGAPYSGGGWPMNNSWGSGAGAGVAGGIGGGLAAGLVGGLLGGALLGGGLLGGNNATKDVAVETSKQVGDLQGSMFAASLAAADRGYQQTIAFNQQMAEVDRDVLKSGYDASRQMCDGFNTNNVVALQNKYDYAMQMANLGYAQEKCCCETNQNITRMGYETQLRDACYKNDTDKQFAEIKCLIENTSKDAIIREQAAKICALESRITKEEIIAAMKPVAPVPAYIQANPYENFRPVVRVERDHHDHCCDGRWA